MAFIGYVLPGAFGPELSIQYTSLDIVFDLFEFDRSERLVCLSLLVTYLTAFKRRTIEKWKSESKARQKLAKQKAR